MRADTRAMGPNRYGKSGIRLAVVTRGDPAHRFTDLGIDIRLHGDFDAAHVEGDNAAVLPTDTMRGTCHALARDGIDSVVAYGQRVAARLLEASPAVERAVVDLTVHPWEPLIVDGQAHPHAFRPAAGGTPTFGVDLTRGRPAVVTGGIRGTRVLKTTGSAFSGFLTDQYTTLAEIRDRVMATTVDATWGTTGPDVDHDALSAAVPTTFVTAFARHDGSESVQHTLHAMGTAALDAHPALAWIHFVMPNEHHIVSDLSPYGLDNPGVVHLVADRPYGVIEGTVAREGVVPPEQW